MGWLRDLMEGAQPPIRSFGALARAALASPGWPADAQVQARSLASIFSKLDRDQELEWLADRGAVQQVLAEQLGCPLSDLRQASSGAPATLETATRRVRLADVPYARALDLVAEPLPPGFPREVTRPSSWERLWWHAPGGSGRSLAGRWLAARGLAAFVQGRHFHEVELPPRGAAFVELAAADGEVPPLRAPICVAAPFLPADRSAWHVVESPPVGSFADALSDWLDDRLPPDGHFEPARAVEWIEKGPIADGLADTLGTALGLLGLVDELGVRALSGRSVSELARRYFRDRLAQASDKGSADAAWLKRAGFDVLLGMMRRALTDSELSWDAPRSFDAWLSLVPPELRRGGDLEWMRLSLAESGAPVRPSDIEKAARLVPPGAYRIVRALSRAGLLAAADGGELLALGPRWFARALLFEARRSLVAASPFEWGEALLVPHAARGVALALSERIVHEQAPVEEVLELEADDNPAFVAALEALFRGVGLSLLGGAELPQEQLEALWDEQLRLLLELPGELPGPRVGPTSDAEGALLHSGSWYLAALSLSEQLPEGSGRKQPLLRPWSATEPPSGLRELYGRIEDAIDRPDADWALAAYALVDRLRSAVGSVALDGDAPHRLERPGLVLDEVAHGVLGWEAFFDVEPGEVDALVDLAARRNMPWPDVARAVWNAWSAVAEDDFPALLAPDGPHAARFWPHLPAALLAPLLGPRGGASMRLPYSAFGAEQWAAFVESWAALRAAPEGARAAWSAIVEEHAMLALDAGVMLSPDAADGAALAALWRRFPRQLAARFRSLAEASGMPAALPLLLGTPPGQTASAVELMGPVTPLLDLPGSALDEVRRFLRDRVHQRAEGWRHAYALLAELEQGLAPVRRARPD